MSFASNHPGQEIGDIITVNGMEQIMWPNHCIQDSPGAEFHPDLNIDKITTVFHKGIDKVIDSYSAFFDNAHLRSTGLGDYLKANEVQDIYLLGLATDYCVKYSALDARQLGFNVYVIVDACRGVELKQGDVTKTLLEMQAAGVILVNSDDIFNTEIPLAS
jgi:nicotinamidase/pyrazinamidase